MGGMGVVKYLGLSTGIFEDGTGDWRALAVAAGAATKL